MSMTGALMTRIVDYAGLFPPAALEMQTAVENYHRYVEGDHAWMLGNFILPASRLAEFTQAFERVCCAEREQPWTLSVVCVGKTAEDASLIEHFQQGAVFIGSLEARAADARSAEEALRILPAARARYVEFAPEHVAKVLPVLASHGARAKLRTGGAQPDAIPSVEAVSGFLLACAHERVAWKATAGLHHAVRGVHSLTSEGGGQAMMHGFVNLFLAAALAWLGADEQAIVRTLEEEDPAAFQFDEDVVRWHGNTLVADQMQQVREHFAMGFGSCSFTEPVQEIEALV